MCHFCSGLKNLPLQIQLYRDVKILYMTVETMGTRRICSSAQLEAFGVSAFFLSPEHLSVLPFIYYQFLPVDGYGGLLESISVLSGRFTTQQKVTGPSQIHLKQRNGTWNPGPQKVSQIVFSLVTRQFAPLPQPEPPPCHFLTLQPRPDQANTPPPAVGTRHSV